jgi:pyruvate formate lyase activating enzyme
MVELSTQTLVSDEKKYHLSGLVFNIQRFSIHDGPGIRTTVFLKGCPLHCFWCHNPEGISPRQQVTYNPTRCILCGECVGVCEHGAHTIKDGIHIYDRSRCVVCGDCIDECAAEAVELAGRLMSVEAVMAEVNADRAFYENSGGGITVSGGEPLLQKEFTSTLLAASKANGIHTAIETSANFRWEELERLLPVVDLVMMDIKHMDNTLHQAFTGVPNHRILANARKLSATNIPIIFHIPVVPTVNDTADQITAIAVFVKELINLRAQQYAERSAPISLGLLPFHRLAGDKYRSLGMDYRASMLDAPSKEKMQDFEAIVKSILNMDQVSSGKVNS